MRRMCYVCGEKPAKRFYDQRWYKYAATESVFCSKHCAAEYGFLKVGILAESTPTWCKKHGWNDVVEGEPECGYCEYGDEPA